MTNTGKGMYVSNRQIMLLTECVWQPFIIKERSRSDRPGCFGILAVFAFIAFLTSPAMAQTFEAENGATFKIVSIEPIVSMNDRSKNNALVMLTDDDDVAHQLVFNCEGYYVPLTSREGWHRIAPRSVLAAIGRTACQRIGRILRPNG